MNGEIPVDHHDGVAVAHLAGDVDISHAVSLRNELMRAISNQEFGLVVDMSDVRYLDSAGVNVLFELAERLSSRQQQLTAVVPDEALIERVISLVNLRSVMPTHRTVDDAVSAVRALAPPVDS